MLAVSHRVRLTTIAILVAMPIHAQSKGRAAASNDAASGTDMTGTLAAAVCSQYYFRGLPQENQGFIAQPSLQLTKPLWAGDDGAIESFAVTLGVWNSLHSGPTGTGGGSEAWFESDFLAGLNATCGDLSATALYLAYASPNGSFTTLQETTLTLAWDDSDLWPGDLFSGLQPAVTFAQELRGQNDLGSARGRYLELGVTPGIKFGLRANRDATERPATPELTLTLPVKVGLSLGDYFEVNGSDQTFGFVDIGVSLGLPVPLPEHLGDWSLTLSVEALWLGDNAAASNGGDTFEVIGTVAAALAF